MAPISYGDGLLQMTHEDCEFRLEIGRFVSVYDSACGELVEELHRLSKIRRSLGFVNIPPNSLNLSTHPRLPLCVPHSPPA